MTSNENEIRRMVDQARQVDAEQKQAKRNADQEVSDQASRRKALAESLRAEIEAKFKAVAAASDGAMAFNKPSTAAAGTAEYQLTWNSPLPARGLSIVIIDENAGLRWGWVTDAPTKRMNTVDASVFGRNQLDQLIRGLADQLTWSKGQTPSVPL
jgi:hypothetical protein